MCECDGVVYTSTRGFVEHHGACFQCTKKILEENKKEAEQFPCPYCGIEGIAWCLALDGATKYFTCYNGHPWDMDKDGNHLEGQ
jgi:predicted RNA-binding Zn-ribbon protein involved in translation (DUF1610 family)